ncbi:MAG TPA: sulfotransferase [Pirellulales bacterium]
MRVGAQAAQVDRPIFIVGSGRCGSTVFHQTLSHHPRVAFLTAACADHPAGLWRNRAILQAIDFPLVGGYFRRRFPTNEHWAFWDWHCRGFSSPCRDLLADDVRPHDEARLRALLSELPAGRRRRPLIKLTGWPRIGFLARLFPDALFIHLVRDGRAVVNSLLDVSFWQGWRGPPNCGFGELSMEEEQEWLRSDKSFVVLAAIQWKRHIDAFQAAKHQVAPGQCLELLYETFIAQPRETMERVLRFCQLEHDSDFTARIASLRLEDQNHKWRGQLTGDQQLLLEDSLRDHLLHYGYEVSAAAARGADDSRRFPAEAIVRYSPAAPI